MIPLDELVSEALHLKSSPFQDRDLGEFKTLGLIFLNPSLRTRMSTQKAAANLGMHVMVLNMDKDGWALETRDGIVMDGSTVEHMREAAAVMGEYCDILGLRSFPGLKDRDEDYSESFYKKFAEYAGVPMVNLESATRHPLQSLTDLITIKEHWQEIGKLKAGFALGKNSPKPKVVLTWAPHIKALPQAVPNSFAEWMREAQRQGLVDFSIANPVGYDLSTEFTDEIEVSHDLETAIAGADFISVKNWSSFENYGAMPPVDGNWLLDQQHLASTNDAKILHCLPVRRDLELSSSILESANSLVIREASNRVWAAQVVLKHILQQLS